VTVHEVPFLPNNTVSETVLHKPGAVRSVHWILSLRAGLVVIGLIHDIGQQVVPYYFYRGSRIIVSVAPTFFSLIADLEDAIIRNTYIM
jgi:hypothetical protein